MAEKQAKMGEKQESIAETNQKWQKTDKNDRKNLKMWSITNYLLQSFPLLSCQAPISVLQNSLFCPAKLINFSRGGAKPPPPPPPNTPMYHCIINHLRWYVVYQLYQCVYRSIYTDREDVNHSRVASISDKMRSSRAMLLWSHPACSLQQHFHDMMMLHLIHTLHLVHRTRLHKTLCNNWNNVLVSP